jgi:hypothetical protein
MRAGRQQQVEVTFKEADHRDRPWLRSWPFRPELEEELREHLKR